MNQFHWNVKGEDNFVDSLRGVDKILKLLENVWKGTKANAFFLEYLKGSFKDFLSQIFRHLLPTKRYQKPLWNLPKLKNERWGSKVITKIIQNNLLLNTQGQLFNLHIHLFTHSQGIPKLGVKFHECTRMHNHSWNWQYLFYDLSCFINVDDIVFHGLSWPGIVFHCNVFVSNVSDRNWLFWWWYLCGVCVIIFDDDWWW